MDDRSEEGETWNRTPECFAKLIVFLKYLKAECTLKICFKQKDCLLNVCEKARQN